MRKIFALLALATLPLTACGDDSTGPDNDAARLVVQNRTSSDIVQVNISPCSATSWGGNRLGADVIAPSRDREFPVAPDCYDVRLLTADLRTAEFNAIEVSGGQARNVMLTN